MNFDSVSTESAVKSVNWLFGMTFADLLGKQYYMRNKSIFILDDDLYFGRCLQKSLQKSNSEVRHFKTERNFTKALAEDPAVVVLDHHLEQGLGLHVMDKLKQNECKPYVLYVSAQENVHVTLSAYKKGALAYFEKNKKTLKEVEDAIHWLKVITDDFQNPLNKEEYRKLYLRNVG